MRTAFGRDHRVDFVDDDRIHGRKHFASSRSEHQVERLGRRDQNIGRITDNSCSLGGRCVTGSDRDGRNMMRHFFS